MPYLIFNVVREAACLYIVMTGCVHIIRHAAQTLPDVYWTPLRTVCGRQKVYSMPSSSAR